MPAAASSVAFDAAGRRLAIRPEGGAPTIWDLGDGSIVDARGPGIAPPADGVELGYVHERTRIVLESGARFSVDGRIEAAAVQPGGALLAAGDGHGRISVWDVASRQPRRVLLDGGAVTALGWSPDGRVLASSTGKMARLWDPYGGERLAELEARAPVTALVFRPDGRSLAVVRDDGLVELRAVGTGALVATLAALGEGRSVAIAPDGAVDGTPASGDPLRWAVGDAALPAPAVWDREAVPGLLAARLATVPAETAPRPGLPGAAAPPEPPACFTRGPGAPSTLISAEATGDHAISLCVDYAAWAPDRARRACSWIRAPASTSR